MYAIEDLRCMKVDIVLVLVGYNAGSMDGRKLICVDENTTITSSSSDL